MLVKFNRNSVEECGYIEQPSQEEILKTPQLWNASLTDALLYGGDLTREAIKVMDLRKYERKYTIVDSKIHMLMPGMYPAIPGWHNDGTPRGLSKSLNAKAAPNFVAQEEMSDNIYHLLVTGEGSLTHFMDGELEIEVKNLDAHAYEKITEKVNLIASKDPDRVWEIKSCTAYKWDWWNMHAAWAAEKHEWRYLIRVLQTDHDQPQTDLRKIIRTQQQVYVPEVFGW